MVERARAAACAGVTRWIDSLTAVGGAEQALRDAKRRRTGGNSQHVFLPTRAERPITPRDPRAKDKDDAARAAARPARCHGRQRTSKTRRASRRRWRRTLSK
eukprot:967204-Alexandrium_andersonii.AAC.1